MINRRRVLETVAAVAIGMSGGRVGRALAQSTAVRVRREQPIVKRTEFDPRHPPSGMPKLTPPESGLCNTTFELEAAVSYSMEILSATTAKVYIDELELVTRLQFDIYTVKGAPEKLRAHEEAHRAIGEYYYKNAAAVAEQVGAALIGASFEGEGPDPDAAQRNGFDRALAALEEVYMARTRVRSAAANVRFDVITNHGLNPIGEAEAVAMAVGADPEN